jgi:thiosulfate/3-mercaptopyruvate sulfurtransferase
MVLHAVPVATFARLIRHDGGWSMSFPRPTIKDVELRSPIIDRAWLDQNRDHVVLVDSRWYLDGRSGLEAYQAGHLPGAIFIDLDDWLAAPGSPEHGRHPLPAPEIFADGMARHGISDDSVVVAYDDAGGVIAARLVWMLRSIGRAAALLDGGVNAYDGPLEVGSAPPRAPGTFSVRPWPQSSLAEIDEVVDFAGVVIDARNRDRYEGAPDPVDPRFGHIPGAQSIPCRANLDANGFLLDPAQVRSAFTEAGVEPGTPVISYCGSGVTACHNLLTMEWVGLGVGRLFPGSWSQYSNSARPIATGAEPG